MRLMCETDHYPASSIREYLSSHAFMVCTGTVLSFLHNCYLVGILVVIVA